MLAFIAMQKAAKDFAINNLCLFYNWFGIDEEDEIEILHDKKCDVLKYVNYIITVFWRVLWAFLPPENLGSGYPCFLICIVCIGVMTALIGKASIYL